MLEIGIIVFGAIILLKFIGLVMAQLYRRTTREIAIVRTGAGANGLSWTGEQLLFRCRMR